MDTHAHLCAEEGAHDHVPCRIKTRSRALNYSFGNKSLPRRQSNLLRSLFSGALERSNCSNRPAKDAVFFSSGAHRHILPPSTILCTLQLYKLRVLLVLLFRSLCLCTARKICASLFAVWSTIPCNLYLFRPRIFATKKAQNNRNGCWFKKQSVPRGAHFTCVAARSERCLSVGCCSRCRRVTRPPLRFYGRASFRYIHSLYYG